MIIRDSCVTDVWDVKEYTRGDVAWVARGIDGHRYGIVLDIEEGAIMKKYHVLIGTRKVFCNQIQEDGHLHQHYDIVGH